MLKSANQRANMELVDGKLIEKTGITFRPAPIQFYPKVFL